MLTHESPIVHADLNAQVYGVLVQRLITRDFEPNQQISITTLAEELGVSRSPVHQALTRLVSENLMAVRPRKGYYVIPITFQSVSEAFDVRMAIELLAAEKSIDFISPPQLAHLRKLIDATLEKIEGDRIIDGSGYVTANQALHTYQVGLAANSLMSYYYGQLSLHLIMGRVAGKRGGGMSHIIQEHQELIASFEVRDLARLQEIIRKHIASGKRVAEEEIAAAGGML